MPHRFRLGQLVRLCRGAFSAHRFADVDFTIVVLLPETEYRIKAKDEPYERVRSRKRIETGD